MGKMETTYERAFQPKYLSTYPNGKLASNYANLLREQDQVGVLLFDENVEARNHNKKKRKSSGCQTSDSQNYCRYISDFDPPELKYASIPNQQYVIVEQSPIPGVYTGSPGLQVPGVGYHIQAPYYPHSTQKVAYSPYQQSVFRNNWGQSSSQLPPMHQCKYNCMPGKMTESYNSSPWRQSHGRDPMRMHCSQVIFPNM